MKVKYRQKQVGWCTVYALANVLQDERFLKFTKEERFKGCNKEEVDFMLHDLQYGMGLGQVLYSNQFYKHLPKGYVYSTLRSFKDEVSENIQVEIPIIPYMLSVRLIESLWHSVAVLMVGDHMYYIDPYREDIIRIDSFEQFDNLFIDCMAVERFYRIQDDRFCILMGEKLGLKELLEDQTA